MTRYRMGVDIGGTFTDFALFDDEAKTIRTHKRLTTPADPAAAVIAGALQLVSEANVALSDIDTVSHGTTLVTNAVIERKGVATAMLVTRGFRDLLDIAMERRYDLFDLTIRFPQPVIPRALRCEVAGRLRADGSELDALDLSGVEEFLAHAIATHRIEAVAICFLHSYANAAHEQAAAEFILARFPTLAVSISSEVFPYIREYPRWTTTTLNAYVQPVVDRYVSRLEKGLRDSGFAGRLLIMGSSGGALTPETARRLPIRLLESGPAAGALMSARHGRDLGFDHVLSFDMGGTTAKGCLIRGGAPLRRYDLEVARVHEFKPGSGLPAKIPVLDMIEIGAGGGSIAGIDERGVLRVGPKSAGAAPGPACYGRGGAQPTLTDANLLLGYLDANSFLGGKMRLDAGSAKHAMDQTVAGPLKLSAAGAAWGVHDVISEDVARAFRMHASEKGVDTRRCAMIAFGGSGPIHAAHVARKLHIPRVVCPVGAGVMSAFGLLSSPIAFETVRSRRIRVSANAMDEMRVMLMDLGDQASRMLLAAGLSAPDVKLRHRIDMRYEGQGYEIEIEPPNTDINAAELRRLFDKEYEATFGLAFAERAVEAVNWKVEAEGPAPAAGVYRLSLDATSHAALKGSRLAWAPERGDFIPYAVYDRYAFGAGGVVEGPALIEEAESTCVLPAGDRLTVDEQLNLVIATGA